MKYDCGFEIPNKIQKIIGNKKYDIDNVGMSGSSVYMFEDKVLKIQTAGNESENEYLMMKWLQGKLLIPEVLAYEKDDSKSYLLMSRISGAMACDDYYMKEPELLMDLLAKAIHALWEVDIADCPSIINLDKKLEMARYNVEHDLVDMDDVQPDTFGEDGFKNPKELLEWLIENRPEEDLVLSHGDLCLPNIFFIGKEVSGFIDLGKMCVADRYQDIALCYRSLINNFKGIYGGEAREGLDTDKFFKKLGVEPDWNKIRYYILLDELF